MKNTFSIPVEGLPLEFTLFHLENDRYSLRFLTKMDGRLSDGGNVFTLDQLKAQGARNRPVLELIAMCLALGFEGQYRIRPQGQIELQHIRNDLLTQLQRFDQDRDPSLSGHWRGAVPKGRFFATTRDDLLEQAALVRKMRAGELDQLEIPPQPIDVLMQQIVACVGAEPLGLTNCLNFGNPEKPAIAWQLTEAVEGLAHACEALEVPVVASDAARPVPEHFLTLIRQQQRGRLKVYLGFAPGVGKTYEMLQEGQRLKRQGVDVVIGIVETHGRAETAAHTKIIEAKAEAEATQVIARAHADEQRAETAGITPMEVMIHAYDALGKLDKVSAQLSRYPAAFEATMVERRNSAIKPPTK